MIWSAVIIVNGKEIKIYDIYTTSYQFRGAKPLPRTGEFIQDEIQDFDSFTDEKGYKIDCYDWEVIGIIHNIKKYTTEIICRTKTHTVRYYKP